MRLKGAQSTHTSSDVIWGHLCQNISGSLQQTNHCLVGYTQGVCSLDDLNTVYNIMRAFLPRYMYQQLWIHTESHNIVLLNLLGGQKFR